MPVDRGLDIVSEDNELPGGNGADLPSSDSDKVLGVCAGGVIECCVLPERLLDCHYCILIAPGSNSKKFELTHQPL